MDQSKEDHTGYLGTYFDRDVSLRVARWAGWLAWIMLILHAFNAFNSVGQYVSMMASGAVTFEGTLIFDRLSIIGLPFTQLAPGLVYFVLLKVAQQVLLILLDVEDNSRRSARK